MHGVLRRTAKLDAGKPDYGSTDVGDKNGRLPVREALLQRPDRPRLSRLPKRVGATLRVKRVNLRA